MLKSGRCTKVERYRVVKTSSAARVRADVGTSTDSRSSLIYLSGAMARGRHLPFAIIDLSRTFAQLQGLCRSCSSRRRQPLDEGSLLSSQRSPCLIWINKRGKHDRCSGQSQDCLLESSLNDPLTQLQTSELRIPQWQRCNGR